MSKNLKISYILCFAFAGILIAWQTLTSFFSGTAINFVALLGLTFALFLILFSDKEVFKRIKDLFFIACGFCVLELVVYLAFEFGWSTFNVLKGFIIYQNIITFIGILYFAYICFRFVCDFKNIKIKFIEIMLRNEKRSIKAKKVKETKEVSNGCLEQKPNKVQSEANEENIIIETEE